ncbi:ABC transporter permease [Pelagibacterium luteolum]|uniref:Putative spermidine/putrescine transport system permease protein n=1 Tax=Pelagibacterium luteolum TaxID=440168 RepID=A0A1G8A7U0_9HYPH|nr:ABC transporter permease [Pelagibacterium luteolum]SDH16921.1 putative spermidine/putrescine transport system permease protein [Pelagibacterium luteolum]
MNQVVSALFWVSLVLVLTFITLPLVVVMAASLSPTAVVTLRPWEWTVQWYGDLWTARWLDPFMLSAQLALIVSIASGVLGLLAAYVVAYEKCPGHAAIMSFLLSPLAVPQIVKGVAIVLFLSSAGLYNWLGTPGLIAAHIILTLPFAVRMIATAMFNFDKNLDRAGQSLGASKMDRIRYLLLPIIKPGVFSGMTFAFIISFNNIPLSVFLVRPGETTLPITVINYIEYSLDPVLAAVNVASLLFVLGVIFIFEKIGGFSAQIHGGSK